MNKIFFLLCVLTFVFTANTAWGDGPGFKPKLPPDNDIKQAIYILSPNSSARWQEGDTQTIRWSKRFNERKGVTIELVDSNNKVVRQIARLLGVPHLPGGAGSGSQPPSSALQGVREYQWHISKDIYRFPGTFRIKITTSDNTAVGYSETFHISMALRNMTVVLPAQTKNYWKRKGQNKKIGFKIPFTDMTIPGYFNTDGILPDPVHPAKILVGYENKYAETNYVVTSTHEYAGYAYRGFIFFPLDDFYGRKGLLTKATLQMRLANTLTWIGDSASNQKYSYATKLMELTGPVQSFNGPSAEVYCTLPQQKGSMEGATFDGIDALTVNITSLVRKWMAYKESNHGLLVIGPNETFGHNNNRQYSLYERISLKIEFIEEDN